VISDRGAVTRTTRVAHLSHVLARDAVKRGRRAPSAFSVARTAIDDGINWLKLAHDITGRKGVSKGFSYLHGWYQAFPETTGYIIGTFLDYARRTGEDDAACRAADMGDWELEVQNPDGGVIEGLLTSRPKPSTIFNTGMVLHGWLDLVEWSYEGDYLDGALRAAAYLLETQDSDGAWRGPCEYYGIPHTYNSRVSWALLRLAKATREARFEQAARRQLAWVLSMQQDSGWFASCKFEPTGKANTHAIAYTLRGLLESYALTCDERLLGAVRRASVPLVQRVLRQGYLEGAFRHDWMPAVTWQCLTGTAQLGGVWLRTYELTGEEQYLDAGSTATKHAASYQERSSWWPIHGALGGSFPVFGGYAPLQYPNWATKFLVDALMLREKVLGATRPPAVTVAGAGETALRELA
jgi:hypothetical protein